MPDLLQDLQNKIYGLHKHYDALKAEYQSIQLMMRDNAGVYDIDDLASQSVNLMAQIQATEAKLIITQKDVDAESARRDKPDYKKAIKMLADLQTRHTLMVVDIVKRVSELLDVIDDLDKSLAEHNKINNQFRMGAKHLALNNRFSGYSNLYYLRDALQQWSKSEQRIARYKEASKIAKV